jgi:hypothetical protein
MTTKWLLLPLIEEIAMINGYIVIDDAYIRHDMERLKDNSGASSHDPANIRQLADCRS